MIWVDLAVERVHWSPYGVHWSPVESIWIMGGTDKTSPNTRPAPQVRPDMAKYRDGEDTFMDGESETSDELWNHVKAGKRRENVESDEEMILISEDEVSLEPVEVDHLC